MCWVEPQSRAALEVVVSTGRGTFVAACRALVGIPSSSGALFGGAFPLASSISHRAIGGRPTGSGYSYPSKSLRSASGGYGKNASLKSCIFFGGSDTKPPSRSLSGGVYAYRCSRFFVHKHHAPDLSTVSLQLRTQGSEHQRTIHIHIVHNPFPSPRYPYGAIPLLAQILQRHGDNEEYIVLGDFNLHHLHWEGIDHCGANREADELLSLAEVNHLQLLLPLHMPSSRRMGVGINSIRTISVSTKTPHQCRQRKSPNHNISIVLDSCIRFGMLMTSVTLDVKFQIQ